MALFPNIKYETSTFFVGDKEHTLVQLDEFKQSVIKNLCEHQIQENFKYRTPSPFDDSDLDKDYRPSSDSESLKENASPTPNTAKKAKKKIRRPTEWKQNVKKMKVNHGESYTTKSGTIKRRKTVQPGCEEKCKLKCTTNVDETTRKQIFTEFYALGDKNHQRNFINACMEQRTARKYRNPNAKRNLNYAYFFKLDNKKIYVCKRFFKSTLDVTNTTISTVIKKKSSVGVVSADNRGKHANHKKLSSNLEQGVIDHINSFARIESHYCRADNQREFIDGGLNIASMYRLYLEEHEKSGEPTVKLSMYSHIFNTKFNIGFFRPKKDYCSFCDKYKNSNTKHLLQNEYNEHILEKDLARQKKKTDIELVKTSEDSAIYCFDLQAVMPLPCGDVSIFYYKSKLNVINFTIYDITEKEGFSYLWHEAEAKRGANEIATCVYFHLTKNCKGKDVIFYADNCCGQNKNKFMISMFLYAVEHSDIKSIEINFLIVGHTQNEGDSMHACIESSKKRVLHSGPIYIPDQISMIIKLAKKTGKPYIVHEIKHGDILDWKSVSSSYGNLDVNTNGDKVYWNCIKIIRVEKSDTSSLPNVYYKTSYQQETFQAIKLKLHNKKPAEIKKAYTEKPKIPYKKKEALVSLLRHIPEEYQPFYRNLKCTRKGENEENSD